MNAGPQLQPMPMGCIVHRNRHGNLTFRIHYRGRAFWEGLGVVDTPANRRLADAQAVIIGDEIGRGTFDYLRWFPGGNKAHLFQEERARAERKTMGQYYARWIADKKPPICKRSRWRNYSSHFANHLLGELGDKYLDSFTFADIRAIRTALVDTKHLTMKTARNVIDATLRAFFRDAVTDHAIVRSPFDDQPANFWPRAVRAEPDPFDEAERDIITTYLSHKYARKWPAGAAFCYALFWTGARPSELTARRWRDLDPRSGKLSITSSRTEGEEGATKTSGSTRAIDLFDHVLERILALKPLRAQPDDYIFTQRDGKPINHWKYSERYFQGALTAKNIRHRDFYCTRHTFISVMLSHGENLKQLADYVGSSPLMISTRYGKWIKGKGTFGHAATAAAAEIKKAREG